MNLATHIIYGLIYPFFNLSHPKKVIGSENIPEGGALVAANHTSNADPLFIMYAFKRASKLRIIAKEEIVKWPLVGWVLKKSEQLIWIKRGQADLAAIKAGLKVLKGDGKLLIFPEGTRNQETGEGKNGAAMMAIRSGVPILPVYIPAKRKAFCRTPVVIGKPYYPFTEDRKATSEDYTRVTKELMDIISSLESEIR